MHLKGKIVVELAKVSLKSSKDFIRKGIHSKTVLELITAHILSLSPISGVYYPDTGKFDARRKGNRWMPKSLAILSLGATNDGKLIPRVAGALKRKKNAIFEPDWHRITLSAPPLFVKNIKGGPDNSMAPALNAALKPFNSKILEEAENRFKPRNGYAGIR